MHAGMSEGVSQQSLMINRSFKMTRVAMQKCFCGESRTSLKDEMKIVEGNRVFFVEAMAIDDVKKKPCSIVNLLVFLISVRWFFPIYSDFLQSF